MNTKGIAALEAMVVVVALLAAFTVAVPLFIQTNPMDKNTLTMEKLKVLKECIVGDPKKMSMKTRTSFGFVGDLGELPGDSNGLLNLRYLFENSGDFYPYWAQQPVDYFLWGWKGPYVEESALTDAWSQDYRFQLQDGSTTIWEIRSSGENRGFGDSDDLWITINESEIRNFVKGTFKKHMSPHTEDTSVTGTTLDIYYPNGQNHTVLTVNVTSGIYSTEEFAQDGKLPIGVRYFTDNSVYYKLAAINGCEYYNGEEERISVVDFINPVTPSVDYDNPFDSDRIDELEYFGDNDEQWERQGTDGVDSHMILDATTDEYVNVLTFKDSLTYGSNYAIEVDVEITDSAARDTFGIDYRALYNESATPSRGYRFKYCPDDNPVSRTVTRYPNFSTTPSWAMPAGFDGFGLFKFTITVTSNDFPDRITHNIKIEKFVGGVFIEQPGWAWQFFESLNSNSSLAGNVGLLVSGESGSVKLHHIRVTHL
ncbi:MAG: hypothetical protein GY757_55305 [bacterium]|nr:hypothetical protein [bacterium]